MPDDHGFRCGSAGSNRCHGMRWNLLPAGRRADLLPDLCVFALWVYGEQRAYNEADLR